MFGNGSDKFFSLSVPHILVPPLGNESAICEHGFLLYKSQILAAGAVPVTVKETNGKIRAQDIILASKRRTKLMFIIVPANPAGTFLKLHLLRMVLPTRMALLKDSAYAEYVIDDRYNNGKAVYQKNVVITRTFSKMHGLNARRQQSWKPLQRKQYCAKPRER